MLLRMTQTLATTTQTYAAGQSYHFDDAEAKRLIAGGIAVELGSNGQPVATEGVNLPNSVGTGGEPVTPGTDTGNRQTLDAVTGKPVEQAGVVTQPAGLTTAKLAGVGASGNASATAANVPLEPSNPGVPELYGRPLDVYEKMSDEEIIDLPGIGRSKLKNIREAIAEYRAGQPAPPAGNGASEQGSQTAPAPTDN